MFGIGTVARLAGVSTRTLRYYDDIGLLHPVPGLPRVAATVIKGDDFHAGCAALHRWIDDAGERRCGEVREIYLDCDGPRDTWVVELQLAVAPR